MSNDYTVCILRLLKNKKNDSLVGEFGKITDMKYDHKIICFLI